MKKILALVLSLLGGTPALAGVTCTLPFTLTNGSLADATQVMANYNALVSCLASTAASGANTDITSLGGLTVPLSTTQGGTPVFISATTSSGSANAQVITAVNPSNFSLTAGFKIVYKSGFINTGPTQINVNGTGLTNVFRRTSDGILPLVGGEITASITEAVFDGVQFQLIASVSPFPIGTVLDTIAGVADAGFLLLQSQCISTTTFSALWTKMGSPGTGGCSAGNFPLPDGRGRVVAQIDSGGSGRITAAGGNFDGTLLYGSGGAQNTTFAIGNLPNTNFSGGTASSVSVTGTGNVRYNQASNLAATGATTYTINIANTGGVVSSDNPVTISGSGSATGVSVPTGGSGMPFSQLQPTLMLNRQIKY